jgi:hypothetical protein
LHTPSFLLQRPRWNVWYDIGFTERFRRDPLGTPNGSPFALRYLGYELWSFFRAGTAVAGDVSLPHLFH